MANLVLLQVFVLSLLRVSKSTNLGCAFSRFLKHIQAKGGVILNGGGHVLVCVEARPEACFFLAQLLETGHEGPKRGLVWERNNHHSPRISGGSWRKNT